MLLLLLACTKDPPVADDSEAAAGDDSTSDVVDLDHDGWSAEEDCDDQNAVRSPGTPEFCDGMDNDCDEIVDEGFDLDEDGYLPVGACREGDDCDDSDANVHPDMAETAYDGIDQDCDGSDLVDVDGDGYTATSMGGNDCNDEDPEIRPGAKEVLKNGIDEDCFGGDNIDGDKDGYGDASMGGTDCDDSEPLVHPNSLDLSGDGEDSDCDGDDVTTLALSDSKISISATSSALVGESVTFCDLDEDGLDDLVVAAPFGANYAGQVGIFYGSGASAWTKGMTISDADAVITGTSLSFIGFSTVCEDLDGDGHMDIAFEQGEIYYSPSGLWTSFGLYLFYGAGTKMSGKVSISKANAYFSYDMGVPDYLYIWTVPVWSGDLDGDGASELVVSYGSPYADRFDGEDRVLVLPGARYSGSADLGDALSDVIAPDQPWQISGSPPVSDIDGDGEGDLFVLSSYWSSDWDSYDSADTGEPDVAMEGRVDFVGAIGRSGEVLLDDESDASFNGAFSQMRLGSAAIEGDFDGDGNMDVVVGSSGQSASGAKATGGLFLLSNVGTDLVSADMDITSMAEGWCWGAFEGSYLGYTLLNVGDADGDGADDFLVSEPSETFDDGEGGTSTPLFPGRVTLVSGARFSGELSEVADAELLRWTADSTDNMTGNALAAGDVDGDGRLDYAVAEYNTEDSSGDEVGALYITLSGG